MALRRGCGMALKDLLVYVDGTEAALVRLRLAVDLARRHGSHLTVVYVSELSAEQLQELSTAELGLVSAEQLDELNQRLEASIDRAAAPLKQTLEKEHDLKVEWRFVKGLASIAALQHARYVDLSILGHGLDGDSVGYSFSEQLLFVAGRPVLFIPTIGSFSTLGRHIVVAWNSSRPAARAVNDALALIERADRTTVLAINPADFIGRHRAPPIEWLVEHLRRHGADADVVQLQNIPAASIGDALLAEACALGGDLLVAGAFGHPKVWEKLLGGVTCDLLARMTLPILMSH
jgi:nucleotide-binding universal stress UspA family protein